ncbi:hypothetical protein FZI91_03640 [Mycobacterium sp. CBMA271]|nr:hypothetical protein [Mycobacteroides sp. CBMA 271]
MQHARAGSREGLAHRTVGLLRSDFPYLTGFGQGSCISSAIHEEDTYRPAMGETQPRQPVKCR